MRIVEVIPQLCSGGGERFTVDLCNELAKQHEVMLLVLFSLDGYGFYAGEISDKVKVVSMNKRLGTDLGLPWRVYKTIRDFNPDVVQTHLRAITYTVLAAMLLRKVKFFHTVHNDAEKEASGRISRIVRRCMFKSGRFVPVTISDESHRSFVDFYGMDAPMIFNGRNIPDNYRATETVKAEIDGYRHKNGGRIIINLARHSEVKRQPLIARVCRRLEDEGYKFTMLMIGKQYHEEFTEQILAAGCSRVVMLGERKNPLDYLAESDAYCLMSSYEGMPISLIEALGVGAVPVCTPVGGIVDVVEDGINGYLAKDITENSCYLALKRFLDMDDAALTAMKTAAKQSYKPFSMTECAEKYVNLFEQKLAGE